MASDEEFLLPGVVFGVLGVVLGLINVVQLFADKRPGLRANPPGELQVMFHYWCSWAGLFQCVCGFVLARSTFGWYIVSVGFVFSQLQNCAMMCVLHLVRLTVCNAFEASKVDLHPRVHNVFKIVPWTNQAAQLLPWALMIATDDYRYQIISALYSLLYWGSGPFLLVGFLRILRNGIRRAEIEMHLPADSRLNQGVHTFSMFVLRLSVLVFGIFLVCIVSLYELLTMTNNKVFVGPDNPNLISTPQYDALCLGAATVALGLVTIWMFRAFRLPCRSDHAVVSLVEQSHAAVESQLSHTSPKTNNQASPSQMRLFVTVSKAQRRRASTMSSHAAAAVSSADIDDSKHTHSPTNQNNTTPTAATAKSGAANDSPHAATALVAPLPSSDPNRVHVSDDIDHDADAHGQAVVVSTDSSTAATPSSLR